MFGGGYGGMDEIHYMFVDGASLSEYIKHISRKYFDARLFEVDFQQLYSSFGATKLFYYDAVPVRDYGETEDDHKARIKPIMTVFEAARRVDGVHVFEGDARHRRKRGLEQKKVDVALAVDVLTHTFQRNMHKMTLITGDADFQPLLNALVQFGMFTTLCYPPDQTNDELLHAADARVPLTLERIQRILTEESRSEFKLPTSYELSKMVAPETLRTIRRNNGAVQYICKDGDDFYLTADGAAECYRHNNYELYRQWYNERWGVDLPENPRGDDIKE